MPEERKKTGKFVQMSFAEVLASVQNSFRTRRMRRFARSFTLSRNERILDVGGTSEIWKLLTERPKVVVLNMPRAGESSADVVHGSGCHLPFGDGAFEIVFSNSVIEHVGGDREQEQFAAEVRRVGRGYWVQTPNKFFPVEAHLLTPFVHLLPRGVSTAIVRRFTVWGVLTRPTKDRREFYVEHFINDIRLLDARRLKQLFPDAVIIRERFLGMTKSLIACRRR